MKKFSICIPNYNYANYLGKTLQSAVTQTHDNYEIVISDNASTDTSVEIIKQFCKQHAFVNYKINPCNLGFAGNLDECGRMASGEWMIMLSSDDIITNTALEEYQKLINLVTQNNNLNCVISSTFEKIGPQDEFIEYLGPKESSLWTSNDIDQDLSEKLGAVVYKIKSTDLLNRCLPKFHNPFNFAATCYPAKCYQNVGGYGGSRMMNPDKWFHWKLLAEVEYAYFIDKPLFKYRWHQFNQTAQLGESGVLKFWVDEYRNSFDPDEKMLSKAGINKNQLVTAFVLHMVKYIIQAIKDNNTLTAKRLYHFVYGCYPIALRKSKYSFALKILLISVPISSILVNFAFKLRKKQLSQ